jgi:outer membrane protein
MKKFFTVLMIAFGLAAGNAGAQMKIGYIRIDDMVGLMPQTAKVDTMLQQYQADSLNPRLKMEVEGFQYKDSILTKTDTSNTAKSVLNEMKRDRDNHLYFINNFQQLAQQAVQAKQDELLAPIYSQVYEAIKAVAKEKGYTHVLSQDIFLIAPDADNLIFAVAAKLKVKLPSQAQPPSTQGGAKPPAGNKPNQ